MRSNDDDGKWRLWMGPQAPPFRAQHHGDADGAVGADSRILHDRRHRVARCPAANPVAAVRETVLVKRPREQQRGAHHQADRHGRRKIHRTQPPYTDPDPSDQRADQGKKPCRLRQPARLKTVETRHRQSGQKLDPGQKKQKLPFHRVSQASLSLTPSPSNVATSANNATPARATESAKAAPLPSPRRIPRSSSG